MTATVVAFMNPKGGNGKTPTWKNLARYAQMEGLNVLTINSDKTSNTELWIAGREEAFVEGKIKTADFPDYTFKAPTKVSAYVKKMKEQYDLVLIDTQADFSEGHLDMLKSIDLVIMPIKPGVDNFESSSMGLVMIERHKKENKLTRPIVTVALTQVKKGKTSVQEIIREMEKYQIPVYENKTRLSEYYSQAHKRRQTILDWYLESTTKTAKESLYRAYTDTKLLCGEIMNLITQFQEKDNKRGE